MIPTPRQRPWCTAILAVATAYGGTVAAQQAGPENPDRAAIAAVFETFVKAFNAHDASAMSVLWSEHAVHHSATAGRELAGRRAVADAYAALFQHDPKSTLSLHIEALRFEAANKALATGVATVDHDTFAPTRSRFAARLVRDGGSWLIDRVDEADLPPDAATGLSPLAWLAGTWVDDATSGRVVNQFSWADNHAFLVRRFWHEPPKDAKDAVAPLQGTQVIGWDPEQRCIRAWLFDSNGSFGEGVWQDAGESKWTNKLVVKLPDGRRGSLTQVLQKLGDDQISLQSIDRELDGAAQPNGAVAKFKRMPESSAPAPRVGSASEGGVR